MNRRSDRNRASGERNETAEFPADASEQAVRASAARASDDQGESAHEDDGVEAGRQARSDVEPRAADSDLLPLVQSAILPGLHLKYGPSPALRDATVTERREVDARILSAFMDSLIASDLEAAWSHVEKLRGQGASAEWIVLELFTAAAIGLGQRWEDDDNSFADVTIAMSHLSAFLRRNSEEFLANGRRHRIDCRILMATTPGEQHTFGLGVASEYFLRAGFDVHTQGDTTLTSLVEQVRQQSFDVVGLSLGAVNHKDDLAAAIRKVRRASRQRSVGVVVGGPLFSLYPELYREVGADMMIGDIREGPVRVMKLVNLLTRRHGER